MIVDISASAGVISKSNIRVPLGGPLEFQQSTCVVDIPSDVVNCSIATTVFLSALGTKVHQQEHHLPIPPVRIRHNATKNRGVKKRTVRPEQ